MATPALRVTRSLKYVQSMAYRVDLTMRASRDLRCIYRYIHATDSMKARDWFNGLEEAVLSLGDNPERCPATPENKSLRHLLYGNKQHVYRVIYAVDKRHRVVSVLHIRHSARKGLAGMG